MNVRKCAAKQINQPLRIILCKSKQNLLLCWGKSAIICAEKRKKQALPYKKLRLIQQKNVFLQQIRICVHCLHRLKRGSAPHKNDLYGIF